jgi:hypothetical protein
LIVLRRRGLAATQVSIMVEFVPLRDESRQGASRQCASASRDLALTL